MKQIFINNHDEGLFNQIKYDDEKAFESLFKKYYTSLCRYAHTYLKDKEASEDITQEVFINIWNNREKITVNTSVRSYLYRSVSNHAINFLKRSSRYHVKSIENIQGFEIADEEPEIDENEFSEMEKNISEAIDLLPDKCRKIFTLSRVDGLKYKEIAEQLEISIKTVETQMSIALKKLRDILSPDL